jgi:hypothetical protein
LRHPVARIHAKRAQARCAAFRVPDRPEAFP